jgi:ABC-2 type transport system ATP-binding protein
MYDDIVSFAELGRCMDQKLKNYSSGMHVRLAFSIAIRAQSDILLIDEVLAVGDANFQDKCIRVFKQLKAEGRTIVFISHDMGMVRRFCDRAIMIHQGVLVAEGEPDKIAEDYEDINLPTDGEVISIKALNREIELKTNKIINKLILKNSEGKETQTFNTGEEISLYVNMKKSENVKNIGVAVYTKKGDYVFGTNTVNDKFNMKTKIKYTFKADLGEGEYITRLGVFGEDDNDIYEYYDRGPTFLIRDKGQSNNGWQGVTYLDHKWDD